MHSLPMGNKTKYTRKKEKKFNYRAFLSYYRLLHQTYWMEVLKHISQMCFVSSALQCTTVSISWIGLRLFNTQLVVAAAATAVDDGVVFVFVVVVVVSGTASNNYACVIRSNESIQFTFTRKQFIANYKQINKNPLLDERKSQLTQDDCIFIG